MTDLHADLLTGLRLGWRPLGVVALLLVGLTVSGWAVGYMQGSKAAEVRATEAERKAIEATGRADAEAAAARRAKADEAQARAQIADADARAERAAARVARLRPGAGPSPAVDPLPGPLEPLGLVDALTEQVTAERARVAARDLQIASLQQQAYRWEAAFTEERRAKVSIQLALEAQRAAAKGAEARAYWRGFGMGFLTGNATGGAAVYHLRSR